MATERTFSIIKPDAVERNKIGEITAMLESTGLRIVASKRIKLSQEKAAQFYGVHKDRPFFSSLVEYMTSGMIIAIELEKDNAVRDFRELIGNTNPDDAKDGTIRKKFAINQSNNSIHGSDSIENAIKEINLIF